MGTIEIIIICQLYRIKSLINIMKRAHHTRGVQKVLQIDIQKIHKALEFDFI